MGQDGSNWRDERFKEIMQLRDSQSELVKQRKNILNEYKDKERAIKSRMGEIWSELRAGYTPELPLTTD